MPGLDEWLMAFWELSTDRQIGMNVVGPIPAASVDRWARSYPGEEDAFRSAIRAMDRVFLAHANGKQDPASMPKDALPTLTPSAIRQGRSD